MKKLSFLATLILLFSFATGVVPIKSDSAGPPTDPILRINTEMHTATIRRIGVDANENTLITSSNDKTVRLWEINSGRLMNILRVPINRRNDGKLYAAAISPDGSVVAAGGWTGYDWDGEDSIYILDPHTGRMLHRIAGLPDVLDHMAFSPNGRYLAAISKYNGIYFYDAKNWDLVAQDSDYSENSYWAAFDGTGRVATTSYDGFVRLYDNNFKLIAKKKTPGGERPYSCAFSPDGSKLVVGFDDTTNVNVLSGQTLDFLYAPDTSGIEGGNLFAVAWSADGAYIYAGGLYWDGNLSCRPILRWYNGGRGSRIAIQGTSNSIMHIVSLSDGRTVYSSYDPSWGVLNSSGERIFHRESDIADHRDNWEGNMISYDGSEVRFGYEVWGASPALFSVKDRRLDLSAPTEGLFKPKVESKKLNVTDWKSSTAPKLNGNTIVIENYERSLSLAISPGEDSFVLGADWNIYGFDKEGEQLWKTPITGAAWGVNVSGDGRLVAAALGDGTIRWYRMTDGEEILAFFPHKDRKRWVLWTPSGYYASSVGGDDLIGWHVNNGRDRAPDFYPALQFRDKFYRPEITEQTLVTLDESRAISRAVEITGRKTTQIAIKNILPPKVQILSHRDGDTFSGNQVTIGFTIETPSGEPVTDVKILVDGRPVSTERGIGGVRPGGTISRTITLPESDCTVSVIASNRFAASVPSTVSLRWRGKTDSAAEKFVVKPKLYVLSIGVGDYQKKELTLEYADKDAQDFAAVWKVQEGKLYRAVEVKVLVNEAATRGGVMDGLDWIEQQVTAKDVAVIFLAGHGVNDRDGDYYFLPYDADPEKLRRFGVPYSTIKDVIESLPGKVLFFVDTCHSGNVMGERRGETDMVRLVNDLSAAENGAVVFAASTGRQYSLENKDWGNGAFTKAVIEGLSGKADYTGKGQITINMLDLYISERVKELTNGQQTPTTAKPATIPDFPVAAD